MAAARPESPQSEPQDQEESTDAIANRTAEAAEEEGQEEREEFGLEEEETAAACEGEDGDDGEVYCVCRRSDVTGTMLGCDFCKDWFHVSTVVYVFVFRHVSGVVFSSYSCSCACRSASEFVSWCTPCVL